MVWGVCLLYVCVGGRQCRGLWGGGRIHLGSLSPILYILKLFFAQSRSQNSGIDFPSMYVHFPLLGWTRFLSKSGNTCFAWRSCHRHAASFLHSGLRMTFL